MIMLYGYLFYPTVSALELHFLPPQTQTSLSELQTEWNTQNSNFLKQAAIQDGVFAKFGVTVTFCLTFFFSYFDGVFVEKLIAKMLHMGNVPPEACACFAHAYSWPGIVYVNFTSHPDMRPLVFML
jgi:hypothetical protein